MQVILLTWLVASIPASWLVMLAPDARNAIVPVLFAWLGIGIAIGWRAGLSRCPRCRSEFHHSRFPFFDTIFSYQCVNCGLTLPRNGITNPITK
jgi:hypothetical protein